MAGRLRLPVLAASLAAIVARHETLRTTFITTPDGPRQLVAPAAPPALTAADLRALAAGRRDSEARVRARTTATTSPPTAN